MLSLLLAAAVVLPVPFVPQQKDTCGAAALAMVLRYHGEPGNHAAIASALVEPELRGIRGSRLADFARQSGMVAVVFSGDLALVREHLGQGRPLVLAIAAGRGRYHDVVLVGFDEASREAVIHDPAVGPERRIAAATLEKRWRETGNWTLLVQPRPAASQAHFERPTPLPSAAAMGTPAEQSQRTTGDGAGAPRGEGTGVGEAAGTYEALVADAVRRARDGDASSATAILDRAVRLAPERPEARVERGGLRFLDGRYDEAVEDLQRALSVRDDAYTRELLAASLQLAGRELEALAAWNPLGQPRLASTEIGGLKRTRDEVARREIGLDEGDLLTPFSVRAARRRLEETGVFDRVTLRAAPRGDGTADLDVALVERSGLARGPVDLLATTAVNLVWQRVRLRYSNVGGSGVSIAGSVRWQQSRPETALQMNWPRLFDLPGQLRLSVFRGEQAYDLGGPFRMRRTGLDLGFRHVLDEGSVLTLGLRARQRSFSGGSAQPGLLIGGEVALERRLVESPHQRLDGTLRAFGATRALGSKLSFGQLEGELKYEAVLARPEGRSVERSVLAARLRAGWGSGGLPVDEMYAPGISPESDLPLRAHPLTRDGVIGANPVGRSLVLLNAEWRQRLLHRPAFDISAVAFTDAAHVFRPAVGTGGRLLVDAGLGVRVAILAGPTLRVDTAWGLRDDSRALFIGLSQAF